MSEDSGDDPRFGDEEWMKDAFRRFLSGDESFNPEELMKAAGVNVSADELKQMMMQLGTSFAPGGGLKPQASRDHAVTVAKEGQHALDPATSESLSQAAGIASLWLTDVTSISDLPETPVVGTRADWARVTLPVWEEIADPVATAIPRAISQMMASQAPEDMQGLIGGMSGPMEQVSKSLFTMQLAGAVGKLSGEVLSGGDIGIPLVSGSSEHDVKAFLLAQNMRDFSRDLDVPQEEADIYLATREIAHARLFRHAKWLRLHIMSAIRDFAGGISIDLSRVMELAEDFDPTNAEAMKELLTTGALLPERTEEQNRALQRLESMLALIEGWVDHVTGLATARLPKSDSLSEAIRRRRASGGPAEHAFATLVGLELRPRKLREASALWGEIHRELGAEARDDLWRHPDTLPHGEDLDNPAGFFARVAEPAGGDDFDQALRDLLDEESPES